MYTHSVRVGATCRILPARDVAPQIPSYVRRRDAPAGRQPSSASTASRVCSASSAAADGLSRAEARRRARWACRTRPARGARAARAGPTRRDRYRDHREPGTRADTTPRGGSHGRRCAATSARGAQPRGARRAARRRRRRRDAPSHRAWRSAGPSTGTAGAPMTRSAPAGDVAHGNRDRSRLDNAKAAVGNHAMRDPTAADALRVHDFDPEQRAEERRGQVDRAVGRHRTRRSG